MENTRRAIALVLCVLLSAAPSGFSKGKSQNDWTLLKSLKAGDNLRVELNKGNAVNGTFIAWSDTDLSIMSGNQSQSLRQSDVERVYRVGHRTPVKGTLIGAGIGAGAGAAIGAAAGGNSTSSGFGGFLNRSQLAGVFAAIGLVAGAVMGFCVGVPHTRSLIYES